MQRRALVPESHPPTNRRPRVAGLSTCSRCPRCPTSRITGPGSARKGPNHRKWRPPSGRPKVWSGPGTGGAPTVNRTCQLPALTREPPAVIRPTVAAPAPPKTLPDEATACDYCGDLHSHPSVFAASSHSTRAPGPRWARVRRPRVARTPAPGPWGRVLATRRRRGSCSVPQVTLRCCQEGR